MGIASWLPHYMTSAPYDDTYRFYSNLAPSLGISLDFAHTDKVDWDLFRQRMALWRSTAPLFYADYYPLTGWSNTQDTWLAWQFDRPQAGDGILQAFRRQESPEASQTLRLFGLDAAATYEFIPLESDPALTPAFRLSGKELVESGLTVQIINHPGAAAYTYHRRTPDAN